MGEVYEDDDHHIATGISLKPVSQKNSGEKREVNCGGNNREILLFIHSV